VDDELVVKCGLKTRGEQLIAWAHGWSLSRGKRAPVVTDGGVRIDLGRQDDANRYVLSAFDTESVSRLGEALTTRGTEIKVLAGSAALRACLGGGWSMYGACELMTSTFGRAAVELPDGYVFRVAGAGGVIAVEICDGGDSVVASARLARWGRLGIVDQVETVAPHRRRGLATAAMAILGDRAVGWGLRTGLLSATEQGASLYRRLGWGSVGEVAGAVREH
jgi:hypothetical protein